MHVCPSNEALTRLVHQATRGTICAIVVRFRKKYELKRIKVPEFVAPDSGVSLPDPRNVVTAEAFALVGSLRRAAAVVATWKAEYGLVPLFLFSTKRRHPGRCRWVMLGDSGERLRAHQSPEFAVIV